MLPSKPKAMVSKHCSQLILRISWLGGEVLLSPSGVNSDEVVSCPRNSMHFVAIKMGRRQGARSRAYLNRYVSDEQRSRRPIFIATLRAGAGWPFFCVALSTRMIQIWALR